MSQLKTEVEVVFTLSERNDLTMALDCYVKHLEPVRGVFGVADYVKTIEALRQRIAAAPLRSQS